MSHDIKSRKPRPAHGHFQGLGTMGGHMTLLATYPLHVNGAYLTKRHTHTLLRDLNVYALA